MKEQIMERMENDLIRAQVRSRYAGIAGTDTACCSSGCSSPSLSNKSTFSTRLGYSPEEMAVVPAGADMGLGCGNPQAIAALQPGETVLDLGSGGGFDCFLAAHQVGEKGQVIGVDMTPEMVAKARNNARTAEVTNVEFRLGEIEHLPIADSSVDIIISNCVINLSPAKEQVFSEAYRVLRKGGRLAISDVVAVSSLPENVIQNMDAHCGCVAGAAQVTEIEEMLARTGFTKIAVAVQKDSDQFIRDWFPSSGIENPFSNNHCIQTTGAC
jgi:arsenite methyltransferase